MSGETAALISAFSSAIAALFGALMLAMRQSREDWKALYLQEKQDHKESLKDAATEARENAKTYDNLTAAMTSLSGNVITMAGNIDQLFDMVAAIPRRESDHPARPIRRST